MQACYSGLQVEDSFDTTYHKFIDIYRHNHPEGRDMTYLKDGNDRMRLDKGSRLDKFLVTEDLLIKEVKFNHTRDHFYTMEYGMQGHSFDHGSVRMTFNKIQNTNRARSV